MTFNYEYQGEFVVVEATCVGCNAVKRLLTNKNEFESYKKGAADYREAFLSNTEEERCWLLNEACPECMDKYADKRKIDRELCDLLGRRVGSFDPDEVGAHEAMLLGGDLATLALFRIHMNPDGSIYLSADVAEKVVAAIINNRMSPDWFKE